MTTLLQWAHRHGVTPQAWHELQLLMGCQTDPTGPADGSAESAVQTRIRLEHTRRGGRLWRNNTGVAYDDRGVPVRFGLCNDSPQVSKICKSSDLIGITRNPHCGCGIFTAIECKHPGWRYKGNAHEKAQLTFIELVLSMGGIAKFATSEGDL